MLEGLLRKSGEYVSSKVPQFNQFMGNAMNAAKQGATPADIITCCEMMAKQLGMGDKLNDPQVQNVLNSFKQKNCDEVIPHGKKLLEQSGKFGFIMRVLGLGGNNGGQ